MLGILISYLIADSLTPHWGVTTNIRRKYDFGSRVSFYCKVARFSCIYFEF